VSYRLVAVVARYRLDKVAFQSCLG